jgi:hypothetical protein
MGRMTERAVLRSLTTATHTHTHSDTHTQHYNSQLQRTCPGVFRWCEQVDES